MASTTTLQSLRPLIKLWKFAMVFPYDENFQYCKGARNVSASALVTSTLLIFLLRLIWVQDMPGFGTMTFIWLSLPRIVCDSAILLAQARAMVLRGDKMSTLGYRFRLFCQDLDHSWASLKVSTALYIAVQVALVLDLEIIEGLRYHTAWVLTILPLNILIFFVVTNFTTVLEVYRRRVEGLFEEVDDGRAEAATHEALEIIAACEELNDLFGVQIFLLTLLVIFDLMLYGSFFGFFVTGKVIHTTRALNKVIRIFLYGSCSVVKLLLVTRSCNNFTTSMEKFNIHLFQRTRKDKKLSDNDYIRLYVAKKPNVTFTACELFSLNNSLITKILGSVTTYLVILVQFMNVNRGAIE